MAEFKLTTKVKKIKGKSFCNDIDISWDLQIADGYLSEHEDERQEQLALRQKEIDAGTYYAKLARNRAWLGGGKLKDIKGKPYMACSAKLLTNERLAGATFETAYDFVYWLNYGDRSVYGWFTVEQVQQWLRFDRALLVDLKDDCDDERPKHTADVRKLYETRER